MLIIALNIKKNKKIEKKNFLYLLINQVIYCNND